MKKLESFLLIGLGVLVVLTAIAFLTPSLRTAVQSRLFSGEREVLGKVEGNFSLDPAKPHVKTRLTVVKIREKQNLLIEIYKTEDNTLAKWTDFTFENERESYLTQGDSTSNLSMTDINKDGIFKIVVPALDAQMNPRVHILEYEPGSGSFTLSNSQD